MPVFPSEPTSNPLHHFGRVSLRSRSHMLLVPVRPCMPLLCRRSCTATSDHDCKALLERRVNGVPFPGEPGGMMFRSSMICIDDGRVHRMRNARLSGTYMFPARSATSRPTPRFRFTSGSSSIKCVKNLPFHRRAFSLSRIPSLSLCTTPPVGCARPLF